MLKLEEVLQKHQGYEDNPDLELIRRAHAFAEVAHLGQKRLNGEEVLQHLLRVADYLADNRVDSATLAAALLHDVLEESNVGREVLSQEFGDEVAELVDGLTLVRSAGGRATPGKGKDWENLRHLILASVHDPRALIIRLADKIQNLRTSEVLPQKEREDSAQKVFDIWSPLAEILGLYRFKSEMEDLAFEILDPQSHQKVKSAVEAGSSTISKAVESIRERLAQDLHKENIAHEISSRTKHIYGVYRKISRYEKSGGGKMFDFLGIRVITSEVEDCYRVLDLARRLWKELPELFDDYIAHPKPNGYQSLHAVLEADGYPVEIQIRTQAMHESAEYGLAAHSAYKERGSGFARSAEGGPSKELVDRVNLIKLLVSWGKGQELDLFPDQVFVFTPKGDVKVLLKGATPVDFAFAVHTQIGNECAGSRVGGKAVSLDYPLKTGEVVEILTSKGKKPSVDWLRFVKTEHARSEIEKVVR